MTVKLLVAGDKQLIAPLGKRRNEKSLKAFIETQLTHYRNGVARIRAAAAEAFMWSTEANGSANLLTYVHANLSKNDADKFRAWVGKMSAFTFVDEEGVSKPKNFLGYREKADGKNLAGFYIKSGKEFMAARANVVRDDVHQSNFLDKPEADKKALTLAALLKMLSDIEKNTGNKAEKNDIEVPADVLAQVKALAKTAKAASATLQ